MQDMGFINIKMWMQPVNFVFNTFEDFFQTLFGQPTTAAKLKDLSPEKLEALMVDAKQQYEIQIESAIDPKHFENLIIIAQKY